MGPRTLFTRTLFTRALSLAAGIGLATTIAVAPSAIAKPADKPVKLGSGVFVESVYDLGGKVLMAVRAKSSNQVASQLWVTGGTAKTTKLISKKTIPYYSEDPAVRGGVAYFTRQQDTNSYDLYRSDGTAKGTKLIKKIRRQGGKTGSGADLQYFTTFKKNVYFSTDERAAKMSLHELDYKEMYGLWKTNGTAKGTKVVQRFPKIDGVAAQPQYLMATSKFLFFRMGDKKHGSELWRSNGTAKGTTLVKDLVPGKADSDPKPLVTVGKYLLFTAKNKAGVTQLWRSDGTAKGTTLVKGMGQGEVDRSFVTGGTIYLRTRDGYQWWSLAGPTATAKKLALPDDVDVTEFLPVGGVLYVTGEQGDGWLLPEQLFRYTTSGTTTPLTEFTYGYGGVEDVQQVDGVVYFTESREGGGSMLWRIDGPTSKPVEVAAGFEKLIPTSIGLIALDKNDVPWILPKK